MSLDENIRDSFYEESKHQRRVVNVIGFIDSLVNNPIGTCELCHRHLIALPEPDMAICGGCERKFKFVKNVQKQKKGNLKRKNKQKAQSLVVSQRTDKKKPPDVDLPANATITDETELLPGRDF